MIEPGDDISDSASFGQRASGLLGSRALLELEAAEGKAEPFKDVDTLVADVVVRSLRAEQVLVVADDPPTLSLLGLSDTDRATLEATWAVASQHTKGAWYLPEQVSLKTGLENLPWTFVHYPRFATGIVWEQRTRLLFVDSPAAVFIWAVTEPLFEQLWLPFEFRGRLAGTKSPEDQLASWASFDELVSALGFELDDELAVMRYGGGWGQLRSTGQLEAKQRLLAALSAQASEQLAARYRAYRLAPLIDRYYQKAKNGQARRKQVLTRALEKVLSGFFGGDWLGFLRYLGETPHPNEEIVTALPETKLVVGSAVGVASAGADASTGQAPGAGSSIEERINVLKAYWQQFDEIHSRQAPGMATLWGLVEEDHGGVRIRWEGPDWFSPTLYERLLTPDLCADVERIWATVMLPRWPEHIVTEIAPHALMADTFGIALKFWQGSALTAWFVSEGPYSRTDLSSLAAYHEDALAQLERLGCAVDPALFTELVEEEQCLGPAESFGKESNSIELAPGVTISVPMVMGSRRSGFEGLRDIITHHRRAWADRYLGVYLRARWETELREAARLHAQATAERGKPPTPKQFAKHALASTNHWFGGDMSAFYAAIGQESAVRPVRVALMPADRTSFAMDVFEGLGGQPYERRVVVANRYEGLAKAAEQDRHTKAGWLAEQSLRLTQLEEALGRTPELKEFGTHAFESRSDVVSPDVGAAWATYVAVVETTRMRVTAASGEQPAAPSTTPVPAAQPTAAVPPPPPSPAARWG